MATAPAASHLCPFKHGDIKLDIKLIEKTEAVLCEEMYKKESEKDRN